MSDVILERHRRRLRFRKEGDLRFISHRDLVRVFERAFRRGGFPLGMSEGFHPKARMSFPLALSLGIEADQEVMEVELTQPWSAAEVKVKLSAQMPDGLTIDAVTEIPAGHKKAQVQRLEYRVPLPEERVATVRQAVAHLTAQQQHWVTRPGRAQPLDILADLHRLAVENETLVIEQRATRTAGTHPRDILQALALEDLEDRGLNLKRTKILLSDEIGPPTL